MDSFVENDFRVNGSREIQGNKAYFAAEIYYRAEDFDEARRRFQQILSCYPGDTIAANAVVSIIMSYKREEDWTNLELWADRADRLQLGDPELQAEIRGEIKKFKLTQLLNKADALMKAEKFLQAARDFEKLASQNPDAPWAGEAYFNAAEAYKKEQFYDSAARLFELLVTDSRYNTASFIETSWFEYAETNALFFNFEKAQQAYSTHYERFPESPNRKYVLTRRILMQEASGDIRATAESLEAFADLYPDDAENAILSAIDFYKRLDDTKQVKRLWTTIVERYEKAEGKDDLVIEALNELWKIATKKKDRRATKSLGERMVKEYVDRKQPPGSIAAIAAAQLAFYEIEPDLKKYMKIRVKGGKIDKQRAAIDEKRTLLVSLKERYESLAEYRSFDWTVAAIFRIGELYKEFAEMIYKLPEPKGLDEELMDAYITQIEDLGLQYENEAFGWFEKAVLEARKAKVDNEWSTQALEAINKLKPAEYPIFKDAKSKVSFDPVFTIDVRTPEGR